MNSTGQTAASSGGAAAYEAAAAENGSSPRAYFDGRDESPVSAAPSGEDAFTPPWWVTARRLRCAHPPRLTHPTRCALPRGTSVERSFFRSLNAGFTLACYANSNAAISPTSAAAFSLIDSV